MRISYNSRMQLSSQDTKRAICCAGLKMKRMGRDRGEKSGGGPDHGFTLVSHGRHGLIARSAQSGGLFL